MQIFLQNFASITFWHISDYSITRLNLTLLFQISPCPGWRGVFEKNTKFYKDSLHFTIFCIFFTTFREMLLDFNNISDIFDETIQVFTKYRTIAIIFYTLSQLLGNFCSILTIFPTFFMKLYKFLQNIPRFLLYFTLFHNF